MRNLLLLLAYIGMLCPIYSQANYSVIDQRFINDGYEIPNYIEFEKGKSPQLNELTAFLREYWNDNEDFSLRLKSSFKDAAGEMHHKYVQTYKGVDLEFAEYTAHTINGVVHSLSGKLLAYPPNQTEQALDESAALNAAIDQIGSKLYKWELASEEAAIKQILKDPNASYYPKGELVYISKNLNIEPSEQKLCYRFNIYSHDPMGYEEVFVSASSGELVFRNNLIHTANVKGTAHTAYSGVRLINTDSLAPGQYRLRQTASGLGVNTFNMLTGTNYNNAVDYIDTNNIWNHVNQFYDQYATDAHWGAEMTYEYFFNKYNRNSIDDSGYVMNSYVNFGVNYVNAFWNRMWMTYGNGNPANGITPLVALDIVGHEIVHGLTTNTADLIYAKESGALNESFSDIFGTAIEFYADPNSSWLLGSQIGITIRSMSDPNAYNHPDTYGGLNWIAIPQCDPIGQNDGCGVHINSGVQNFWFYLLCNGGTGNNDNNAAYAVDSIGMDKAAAISYRNLVVYLGRSSDFREARFYSILASSDLYGSCSQEMRAVTNAWHAVGVDSSFSSGVVANFSISDSADCAAPFQVSFKNESYNALNFIWDFGDGIRSSEKDPVHHYTTSGTFSVSLLANGLNCGLDSILKSNLISVDTSNSCVDFFEDNSSVLLTECSGRLYDSGGRNLNYQNNANDTVIIEPAGAGSITLHINMIDIQGSQNLSCSFDNLEIFDGRVPSSSNSMGKFCRSNSPAASYTSSNGVISLVFTSDDRYNNDGFEIDWVCSPPTSLPNASFILSTDTTCEGTVSFTDKSNLGVSSWFWDFGDGFSSTLQNPIHTYSTNGDFSVQMIASNAIGSDSLLLSNAVHVNIPQLSPNATGASCLNQQVNLIANGAGNIKWYSDSLSSTSLYTGDTLSFLQPQSDTTFWIEDAVSSKKSAVGAASAVIGGGAYFTNAAYLLFDVYQEMILHEVFMYVQSNGNQIVQLTDLNGTVLQSQTAFATQGGYAFDLGFTIQPGSYRLTLQNYSGKPAVYRNNSGPSYPYTVPGLMSIYSSSAGANFYYFFYNWKVSAPSCVSPRIPITAFRDTSCTVTSLAENFDLNSISIYPNPTNQNLYLNLASGMENIEISLRDINGRRVKSIQTIRSNRSGSTEKIDMSDLTPGLYFIHLQSEHEQLTKRVVLLR